MKDVVYTAVFDDYDILLNPKEIPKGIDFLCFTDDPKKARGEWKPIVVNNSTLPPDLLNRKYKILPHKFLQEYRYSIYIDSNIHVVGDVSDLFEKYSHNNPLAIAEHPQRNCLYREAEICIEKNLVDEAVVNKQISRYRREGFPKKYGLTENRVLIRDHNDPEVISAMEEWWKELNQGARRDQLSFQYVLWKIGLNPEQLSEDYKSKGGVFYKRAHKPDRFRNSKLGWVYEKKYQLEKEHGHSTSDYIVLSFVFYIGLIIKMINEEGVKDLIDDVIERI